MLYTGLWQDIEQFVSVLLTILTVSPVLSLVLAVDAERTTGGCVGCVFVHINAVFFFSFFLFFFFFFFGFLRQGFSV